MNAERSYGRSPSDYVSVPRSGAEIVPFRGADRPAPSNVTDGRFFGDEIFFDFFQSATASTADQAAKISAVYFCVSLIAEAVGNCPIEFRENGVKVEGFDIADALANGPNPIQTAAEFWPSMLFRAALAGHAFAEPVVEVDEFMLWALHPDRLHVEWRERGFTAHYTHENGDKRIFNASQLFWIAGLADGRTQPLTPWKMAKGTLDFALALDDQGRKFFKEGKRLSGVLETDNKLDEDVHARLTAGINKWKHGQTPLLEEGLKYKQAAANNVDSQFVELIDQRTAEMARYWRIPRSFYAADAGNAKNAETEAQSFVKWTARPWTRRVEQSIRQRLLTPDQRKRFTVKINLDAILRGDSATQWKNAVLARTAGAMSTNELRVQWFDLPRIDEDWADDPRAPLNSNRAADTITGGQTAPQDENEEDRD